MQIIIPMSGIGKRFIDAGYEDPKPLIEIDGMPIIEHVVNLFPGETKFIFICNADHLKTTNMRTILNRIAPQGRIIEIPAHKKGPVYAVSKIFDLLNDDEEVIVNYCDFSCYWNYSDFLNHTRTRNADGAIPAYKGFHPHMLGTTNYAFMRDNNQWMLEIKEKEPFTDNRMNEYASSGTYYFKKGHYVKKYFTLLMEKDINLKGEYYVSLIYNLLIADGLKVSIYEIQHMLQWGTPEDVAEYQSWSHYFRNVIKQKDTPKAKEHSINLIPLAGRGSRFSAAGYNEPKPMIEVSGKPMIIQAADALPKGHDHIFVILQEHLDHYQLKSALEGAYPHCKIIPLTEVTEGQAITCSLGLKNTKADVPLLIAATDNAMIYDKNDYQRLIDDPTIDAIIFTFRHHVSSKINPQMYGWVKTNRNNAVGVSVKVPISDDPYNDHAIVGTFYFRQVDFFNQALKSLLDKNIRVNNEFYVDSMMGELITLGYNVTVFEVDDYICWGTPNDYETFVYWQGFFHKCTWHPYRLEKDRTVNKLKIKELGNLYGTFEQEYP